jgi:hypothetical protein
MRIQKEIFTAEDAEGAEKIKIWKKTNEPRMNT